MTQARYWYHAHKLALFLLVIIFIACNVFAGAVLRNVSVDLTEHKLFTFSDGTRRILANIEEPVTLTFYYSRKIAVDYPHITTYANRVRDILEKIERVADGMVKLQIIDPEIFSEEEDQAVARGLVPSRLRAGEVLYFGLVGHNLVDRIGVIPSFTPDRQQYLEYDIAQLIYNLSIPQKPVLGIMSDLNFDNGPSSASARSAKTMIYRQLEANFSVSFIAKNHAVIPDDVDVLLLIHPQSLSHRRRYAIDQFVMRGGRVIVFIDPLYSAYGRYGSRALMKYGGDNSSNVPRLMDKWGVVMDNTKIIADRKRAQRLIDPQRDIRGNQVSDYILWLALQHSDVNQTDLVTANIDHLKLAMAGALRSSDNATTRFTPLLTSSDKAMLIDREVITAHPSPDQLIDDFVASNEAPYVIAARVSGRVETAYPDGPPSAKDDDLPTIEDYKQADPKDHKSHVDMANIIIFADVDMLDSFFWINQQNLANQSTNASIADNAKIVINAVDNLIGSNDLINLRGREKTLRPFIRVDNLRYRAEEQYHEEEQRLQARIQQARFDLERIKQDTSDLTEVDDAVDSYQTDLLLARKALRAVQANLRRDIDILGRRLMWMNIIIMPLLTGVVFFVISLRRRRRRVATQKAAGFRHVNAKS